jgi:dsRNA-specific ribonuclease
MKKIFDKRCLIRVNDEKEFHETSIFYHLSYMDEEETQTTERVFTDFQKAYEYVENDGVMNAEISRTLFRNRPEIRLSTVHDYCAGYYTEKNFKSLAVRWEYKEVKPSMKTLADLLTSDEFCEYLTDRGITKI